MDNMDKILGKLQDSEEEEIFQIVEMLGDPLTRRIMAKLASPQSPISVDDIPTDKLNGERGAIISRLDKLERRGLVKSEKIETKMGFGKKYIIKDKARDWVTKYMSKELKQYK